MRNGSRRGAPIGTLLAGMALVALMVGACADTKPPFQAEACTRGDLGGESVARVWDEQTLQLIREVVPAPTVHARNLFHVSAAMWDAWAAYDPTADGYFVTEKHTAQDVKAARETAMSYAAYRILLWRYGTVSDLQAAPEELAKTMASLCLETDFDSTDGDSPAALGNRIAAAVIAFGETDGAKEDERYKDSSYVPKNDPLVVAEPGTVMKDPNHWQPLALDKQVSQNGLPIPGQVQTFIGPYWGHVTSFALPPSDQGTPIDPGPPPLLGDASTDQEFKDEAVEIIRRSHLLDATNGITIDISPGEFGNNTLGTNDGHGHDVNPATSQPYEPHVVLQADFARVLAEYWADGPKSETPPGHWNVIANEIADSPDFALRIGGEGLPVDRLEWDTKLYLALNGAVHDAAIATWGAKGFYDFVATDLADPVHGRARPVQRSGRAFLRRRGIAARARPHRGRHLAIRRARRPPCRREGEARRHRHQRLARVSHGSQDPDEWCRLDPRRRLGAVPAQHVRDTRLRGLPVRPQHVQ